MIVFIPTPHRKALDKPVQSLVTQIRMALIAEVKSDQL
jgi:hypothetical protein